MYNHSSSSASHPTTAAASVADDCGTIGGGGDRGGDCGDRLLSLLVPSSDIPCPSPQKLGEEAQAQRQQLVQIEQAAYDALMQEVRVLRAKTSSSCRGDEENSTNNKEAEDRQQQQQQQGASGIAATNTSTVGSAAVSAAASPTSSSTVHLPLAGSHGALPSICTPPSSGSGANSKSSASIFRSSARVQRKTPAFSIVVPEREAVANHVQGCDVAVGKSGASASSPMPCAASSSTLSPLPGGARIGGLSSVSCQNCGSHNTNKNNNASSPASRPALVSSTPTTNVTFNSAPPMCTPTGYHERSFGASAFHATRLLPLLYLGNEGDASMPDEMRHRNIRRILNVAFDCKRQDFSSVGIETLHVPLRDCGDEDIGSHFERCCRWIHEGISKGHGVIIHCRLGVSRSATIAIAYLMTYGITTPTRIMTQQHRYRVIPIAEQKPQGSCPTCWRHGRAWHHYEDNGERINNCQFHTHPDECPQGSGKLYTDYGDVFTYVSMRREQISPNLGFAMQLRKLNVEHGFSDFFAEMTPGPSDDYCGGCPMTANGGASCGGMMMMPSASNSPVGCTMFGARSSSSAEDTTRVVMAPPSVASTASRTATPYSSSCAPPQAAPPSAASFLMMGSPTAMPRQHTAVFKSPPLSSHTNHTYRSSQHDGGVTPTTTVTPSTLVAGGRIPHDEDSSAYPSSDDDAITITTAMATAGTAVHQGKAIM